MCHGDEFSCRETGGRKRHSDNIQYTLVILIDLSVGTPFVAGLTSTSFYFALALKVIILTKKRERNDPYITIKGDNGL